mgnify:CR=1 FL=1
MKEKFIVAVLCMLFFSGFTSTLATWNLSEQEEEVNLKLSLIQPNGNKILQKRVSIEQADTLIKLCRNYYSNTTVNNLFIDGLLKHVFTNNEYKSNELKQLLTPPNFEYMKNLNANMKTYSTSTASQLCCTLSSGGSGRVFPFFLLPRPRLFLNWRGNKENDMAVTTVGSLIKDQGFRAYGGQSGYALGFTGLGLTYGSAYGRVYAFSGYTLFTSVIADQIDVFYPANDKPTISDPNPPDGEQMVPLSLSELSFTISDDDNDLMGYSVTTNPYIGIGSGYLKRDGTYSISVSSLKPSTTYEWTVEVDDGKTTSTETYSFTTVKEEPVVINPVPEDQTTASTSLSELTFELYDAQGDLMDYTVETSPSIGSKSDTQISDGTITVPINGLQDDTWYHWYVNVTDGVHWTKEHYSFYTGSLGLIGYWNFDDGTAKDSSNNGNNGVISGGEIVDGVSGYGVEITDSDEISSIPSSLDDSIQNQFTISTWIKWYGPHQYHNRSYIFDYRGGSTTGFIYLLEEDGSLTFNIKDSKDGLVVKSDIKIPINVWTHVAGIFNYDANQMCIYIDGVKVGTNTTISRYSNCGLSPAIGNNRWPGPRCPLNGIIDEMRIYNRALSSTEIKNLYENP